MNHRLWRLVCERCKLLNANVPAYDVDLRVVPVDGADTLVLLADPWAAVAHRTIPPSRSATCTSGAHPLFAAGFAGLVRPRNARLNSAVVVDLSIRARTAVWGALFRAAAARV